MSDNTQQFKKPTTNITRVPRSYVIKISKAVDVWMHVDRHTGPRIGPQTPLTAYNAIA